MISICIPVFNFDVRDLVKSLYAQCKDLQQKSEIIIIDDCSVASFRKINSEIQSISKYIQLDENIGRAKIRNMFLQFASYDYLLFLDCDSKIINSDFIKNYLSAITKDKNVIVGGRIYPQTKPERNKLLRWKYCLVREQNPASIYSDSTNFPFMSNNFLIKKSLFEKIKFDERLTLYGHEDTLFGYELKKAGIKIYHINNPVLNGDLETNEEFIRKTESSIENLNLILKFMNYEKDFIDEVTLLKKFYLIKRLRLDNLFYIKWKVLQTLIRKILISGFISLWLFDFYKLGFLISIMRSSDKTKTS